MNCKLYHNVVMVLIISSLLTLSSSLSRSSLSRSSLSLSSLSTSSLPRSSLSSLSRSSLSRTSLSLSSIDITNDKNNDTNKQLYQQMLAIAIPSLAACIAEPILTLVDTFCVGKFITSSLATRSLAAMSVNGAIFNVIAAAAYPICTATTSMVSTCLGKMKKDNVIDDDIINNNELKKIFFNGLVVCFFLGIPLTLLMLIFGGDIIGLLINNNDLTVKSNAIKYLKIRALCLPTMLLNDVVFGFSLGLANITAPMYSIVIAFFTNVVLDIILIKYTDLGLVGAAIATSISALLGSTVGMSLLVKKYRLLSSPNLFKIDIDKMKEFFSTSGTMFIGTMLNTLTYSSGASIASFASSTNNVVNVAAQQILMGTWWLLSYFSSPIAYIGMALLPKEKASGGLKTRQIINICMKIGLVVAFLTSSIMFALPLLLPSLFTNDLLVQQAFPKTIIPVVLSLFIICITTTMDGLFIGSGRIWDYVKAGFLSTSSAWVYFLFGIMKKQGLSVSWNGYCNHHPN